MVEYKKFKINEFFKVLRVRHKLTKSQLLSDGKYPCYSSETSNYGILGYTNTPEFHVDDDHSYLIFGDHTRSMRIAETDFSVLDNVKVLKGPKLSGEILLYIETAWHKGIRDMGYARHWKIAKQSDFLLPVTSAGQPDFEYMTQYIKDMEWQCVDDLKAKQKEELQAYLQVTGFTDTTLSGSEAAALTKKVVWKKFRIGKLFNVTGTKSTDAGKVKLSDNGDAQFIGRTQTAYGVQGWVKSNSMGFAPNASNTISVSQVGTIVAQYREVPYYTSQNIAKLSADFLTLEVGLYFCSVINHWISQMNFVGYHTLKLADLRSEEVLLPVTSTGEIDFTYMQNYIRAIEKLTIKNVVKHRNNVINTTQSIIN